MPLATVTSFTRALVPCWLTTYILASFFHTQMVVQALIGLGTEIDLTTRLSISLKDIVGLLPIYGSLIAVALFLSLLITGLITRKFRTNPWLIPVATSLAMLLMLMVMEWVLPFTFIAGTRTLTGIALQMVAGLFGGLIFLTFFHRPAAN